MRYHLTITTGLSLSLLFLAGFCYAQTAADPPGSRATTQQADKPVTPPAAKPKAPSVPTGDEALKVYARGEYARAAKMLEPAYRAGKAGIQDRLILARAYLHMGQDDTALAVLRSVLKTDPENPEANSLAGRLILKAGKAKEALKYLEHAHRLKSDAATTGALGRCHYELGNIAKAKTHLSSALAQDVRNPAHSLLLGRIHLQRGSGALAEKYLLMAQEAGLNTRQFHRLLGRAYLLQHKYLGPVRATRLADKPKPGSVVDGLVVLGPAPDLADQYLVATRFCALHEGLWLLRADANDGDGLYLAAAGWFAAGQYDRAGQRLKALMKRKKPKPGRRAWDLQARLLTETKQFDALQKLLADGKKAGVFDSRAGARYLCKAAGVLRSEGKRDDAVAMLKLAERHQPTAQSVLRPLAALYEAMGNHKTAAGYYARLVELYPDAADIDELNNTLKVLREKKGVTK